jgi:phosphatidylinositol-bisphosphatase
VELNKGNKGAVAIRLRYVDSYITFINSHLASDQAMTERRNQDYENISKRTAFPVHASYKDAHGYYVSHPWSATIYDNVSSLKGSENSVGSKEIPFTLRTNGEYLSMFDTDHLIWMGDLNYRVDLSDEEVRNYIADKDYVSILAADQLLTQRQAKKVFNGFLEQTITFVPSYKYDIGTCMFDTSEKKRCPAYCDRILWKFNPIHGEDREWIVPISYSITTSIVTSDHKPISALFNLKIRKLNQNLVFQYRDEIIRRLDRLENEAMPKIIASQDTLEFGPVSPMERVSRSFTFLNVGKVIAEFGVQDWPAIEKRSPWLQVAPTHALVLPGVKHLVTISINISSSDVYAFNRAIKAIDDVLVFHVTNGKDIFISIRGKFQTSSFGESLPVMCRMLRPAIEYNSEFFQNLIPSTEPESTAINFNVDLSEEPVEVNGVLNIPKQVWRLATFVYKYGLIVVY